MDDKTYLIALAILAITVLEMFALVMGINGQIFSLVVALLAGLAGFESKAVFEKIRR